MSKKKIRLLNMDEIVFSEDSLDVGLLTKSIYDRKAGAVSIFIGTTRNNFKVNGEIKLVSSLEYECYQEMAEKETSKIIKEIRSIYSDLLQIIVHHRLGDCPVGEESIFIGVSSPHRKEAMLAVSYLIDQMKARVPIWKKEVYIDGTCSWKQNSECQGCKNFSKEFPNN